MIRIYTPCPECSELWSIGLIEDKVSYLKSSSSEILVESETYQFFFHPSCSKEHTITEKHKIKPDKNPFSPLHDIYCDYNHTSSLYYSEALGIFNINKEKSVTLSGQGRDRNEKMAIKKSIYELIERISNIYASPSNLSTFSIKCENNSELKISLKHLLPNGVHEVINESLPLRYGIAAHDDKAQAIKNAKKESLEKRFQYHSLTDLRMTFVNEKDGIIYLMSDINSSYKFAVTYANSNKYPYQMLTSSVSETYKSALSHARDELLEKKNFLLKIESLIDEYPVDLYPWIHYAKNKNATCLLDILTSGNVEKLQGINRFLLVNRENILTKQLGIFVYQVLIDSDRSYDLPLRYFPYG